jgi:integrase
MISLTKKGEIMATQKIGRPRKNLIYDDAGNQIAELSFDSGTSTYFSSYKDGNGKFKKATFGRDKLEAIAKFRRWQDDRQGGKLLQIIQSPKPPIRRLKALERQWAERFGGDGSAYVEAIKFVPEEWIWEKARQLIQDNPVLAAQKLKIPALSNPEHLKGLRKPYTLEEIGNTYLDKIEFDKVKGEVKHEKDKVKKAWEGFCKVVGVKTVVELTKDKIKDYYEKIYSEYINKKYSTTWIKGRFERVIRVFNSAINDLDYPSDILEAKLRCNAVLKCPRHETQSPAKRIPKELFWQIMDASNAEEKAMWLLSINLAYYTVDIASLPLTAINFNNKTVIFRRGKTGVHRAGLLWDETIAAIKLYQDEVSHKGKAVFLNMNEKTPYVPNRIRKKFVAVLEGLELREKSENKKTNHNNYVHANFRDSFESICAEKGIPQRSIDAVMGHKTMADKYTDPESAPQITAPACQAVRDYYFGKEDKKD